MAIDDIMDDIKSKVLIPVMALTMAGCGCTLQGNIGFSSGNSSEGKIRLINVETNEPYEEDIAPNGKYSITVPKGKYIRYLGQSVSVDGKKKKKTAMIQRDSVNIDRDMFESIYFTKGIKMTNTPGTTYRYVR